MAHIHTEPGQHDHTVSIYLFRTDFDEPKIVLHLHRKLDSIAQFGGHIELDETPWQAVIHELKEETGYNIDQISVLQPHTRIKSITNSIVHPYPVSHNTMRYKSQDGHGHIDSAYAFIAGEASDADPEEGESTDLRFYTHAELVAAKNDINPITYDIALYIFTNILHSWEAVPAEEFK